MSLEDKIKSKFGTKLDGEDVEDLELNGMVSINSISESDKKYLEKFKILSELSACNLNLTSLDNLPDYLYLDIVSFP